MKMGSALAFLGTRVAKRTVDAVERKVVWGGTGAILSTVALVFVLIAAYQYLLPLIGPVTGAVLIAATCAALGVLAFFTPNILSWLEKQGGSQEIDAVGAIKEEAHAAVDQFGPLKVGLTAFLFGLSAGRTVRGTVRKEN